MLAAALTFPAIDPVALQIGPIAIKWYGLSYVAGLLFAWWYIRRLVINEQLWPPQRPGVQAMTPIMVDDVMFWGALGVMLGGRLGYVLFYKPAEYFADPMSIFAVWDGGMSFHGGFLGVLLAVYIFARKNNASLLQLFDLGGAAVPMGLAFGRIANFINGELWGRVTDASIGMVFPGAGELPRHPSQLYEAGLEGLALFLVIRWLTHSRGAFKTPGFVAGAFALGYGVARVFVEHFREPDAHIGYLAGPVTMGMVLSMPMILAGAALMIWSVQRR